MFKTYDISVSLVNLYINIQSKIVAYLKNYLSWSILSQGYKKFHYQWINKCDFAYIGNKQQNYIILWKEKVKLFHEIQHSFMVNSPKKLVKKGLMVTK